VGVKETRRTGKRAGCIGYLEKSYGERKSAGAKSHNTGAFISEVSTAVAKGDLTRTIRVEAKGEVEALKDTINQMITNLKETTLRNQEQDWLKSNLAKFTQMLQGQRDLNSVTRRILSELAQVVTAHYGAFYIFKQEEETQDVKLKLVAAYGYREDKHVMQEFSIGEGLVGQCAFEKRKNSSLECSA